MMCISRPVYVYVRASDVYIACVMYASCNYNAYIYIHIRKKDLYICIYTNKLVIMHVWCVYTVQIMCTYLVNNIRNVQVTPWRQSGVSDESPGEKWRIFAKKASRGFEPRSLDSESRVLTVTPRGQVQAMKESICLAWSQRAWSRRQPPDRHTTSKEQIIAKHPPWGSNPRPQG